MNLQCIFNVKKKGKHLLPKNVQKIGILNYEIEIIIKVLEFPKPVCSGKDQPLLSFKCSLFVALVCP